MSGVKFLLDTSFLLGMLKSSPIVTEETTMSRITITLEDSLHRALKETAARQGRSITKFKHPGKPGHVVVPHPRKDVAIGTLRNIYRQAGWDWR